MPSEAPRPRMGLVLDQVCAAERSHGGSAAHTHTHAAGKGRSSCPFRSQVKGGNIKIKGFVAGGSAQQSGTHS
jgi:hypothetical protein